MSNPPEDDYYAETGLIGDLERGVGQKLSDYASYELGNVEAVPAHVEARIVSGLIALEQRAEELESERDMLRTVLDDTDKAELLEALEQSTKEALALRERVEGLEELRAVIGDGGDLEAAAGLLRLATNEHGVDQSYGRDPYAISARLDQMSNAAWKLEKAVAAEEEA